MPTDPEPMTETTAGKSESRAYVGRCPLCDQVQWVACPEYVETDELEEQKRRLLEKLLKRTHAICGLSRDYLISDLANLVRAALNPKQP